MARYLTDDQAAQVLAMIARGCSTREISEAAGIAKGTVMRYRAMGKTACRAKAGAKRPSKFRLKIQEFYTCSEAAIRETMGTPLRPRGYETVQERTTKEQP